MAAGDLPVDEPIPRFRAGGVLRRGDFYVPRSADTEVAALLRKGELVSVLAPRQTGKSSLRLRIADALEGSCACAHLDLSTLTSAESAEQFFASLIDETWRAFPSLRGRRDLADVNERWGTLASAQRWHRLLDEVVIPEAGGRLCVLLFDEIDSTLSLPEKVGADFWLAVRSVWQKESGARSGDPLLTFALFGVLDPNMLQLDRERSPFNVGARVALDDLPRGAFDARALGQISAEPEALLDAVLSHTRGHPYLTQRLLIDLADIAQRGEHLAPAADVTAARVAALFLADGLSTDSCLKSVASQFEPVTVTTFGDTRRRVVRSEGDALAVLLRYREVLLRGDAGLQVKHLSREDQRLLLGGLVRTESAKGEMRLFVRNPIFGAVFDEAWSADQVRRLQRPHATPMLAWLRGGRRDDDLLDEKAAEKAHAWLLAHQDVADAEREYIALSWQHRRQRRTLRVVGVAALAVIAAIASVAAIVSDQQRRDAELARQQAAAARRRAEQEAQKAEAQRQRAEREAREAEAQRQRAEREARTAQEQRGRAEEARAETEQARAREATIGAALLRQAHMETHTARLPVLSADATQYVEAVLVAIRTVGAVLGSQTRDAAFERAHRALAAAMVARVALARMVIRDAAGARVSARWSPDGRRVLTYNGHEAYVRDVDGARAVVRMQGHRDTILDAQWRSNTRIVSASRDGMVLVWDAQTGQVVQTSGLGATLEHAALSPDGEVVAATDLQRTTRVWSVRNIARLLQTLSARPGAVLAVAWSPDSRALVTTSGDGSATVWRQGGGAPRIAYPGPGGPVVAVDWSPDARQVVMTNRDGVAWTWHAWDDAPVLPLETQHRPVIQARWSHGGPRILTRNGDGTACIWSPPDAVGASRGDGGVRWSARADAAVRAAEPACLELRAREHGPMLDAQWAPGDQRIASVSEDGTLQVWDATSGRSLLRLEGHRSPVAGVQWSFDGRRLVTSGADGTVRVWDADEQHNGTVLRGHSQPVLRARWSHDGRHILTASGDRSARVWGAETGYPEGAALQHTAEVVDARWSPDDRTILTASRDQGAFVWGFGASSARFVLAPPSGLRAASWSPDGLQIITAGWPRGAGVWDARSGRSLFPTLLHDDVVETAEYAPNGLSIVTAGRDRRAIVWNARTGEFQLPLRGHEDTVTSARWSPDGRRIVTASYDHTARVWSLVRESKNLPLVLRHEDWVYAAEWSPTGQRVVTACRDATAGLWDAETGRALFTLRGHQDAVIMARWSPDGRRVVTASEDGTARVWDVGSGRALLTLEGHSDSLTDADWSPDGTRVVTASRDGTARVQVVVPEYFRAYFCERLPNHPAWSASDSRDVREICCAPPRLPALAAVCPSAASPGPAGRGPAPVAPTQRARPGR